MSSFQGHTSGIESEITSSDFQDSERSPPSHPLPSSIASGEQDRGVEEGVVKGGGGEGVGGGGVTRVDSGIGKDKKWVEVQKKKKSGRQDGRVRQVNFSRRCSDTSNVYVYVTECCLSTDG